MPPRQRYTPLQTSDPDQYAYDKLREEEEKPPLCSILLAVGLLLAGVVFLTFAYLSHAGHVHNKDGTAVGLLVLGILTFTPGFYETRIAYYAWRGRDGYSYSAIPQTR